MKRVTVFLVFAVALCSVFIGCENAKDILHPDLSNLEKSEGLNIPSNLNNSLSGDFQSVRLIAGRNIDVGTVSVWNDKDNLYVKYNTFNDWLLVETHMAAEKNVNAIPQNKPGNPKIGQFQFKASHDPATNEYMYTVALDEGIQDKDIVYISAQAGVRLIQDGETLQEEGAWGEGTSFPGHSNAMYFTYTIVLENGLSDDFEKYAAGTFPSPNWVGTGNAHLPASYVDNTKSMNGLQALKLYCNPNDFVTPTAGAHRRFDISPPYFIEFSVFNGTIPSRAVINIRTSPSLGQNVRTMLDFTKLGILWGTIRSVGATWFKYKRDVWYKVKMKYEITNENKVKVTYWINDIQVDVQEAVPYVYEADFKYLSLEANAGNVWYDDVSVHK